MLLQWRTRFRAGTRSVDIRITRQSGDIWCMDELREEVDAWLITAGSSATDNVVTVGGTASYTATQITLTIAVGPRRYLSEIFGYSGQVTYFYLLWSTRAQIPSDGGSYETMPTESRFTARDEIHCPPEPTAGIQISRGFAYEGQEYTVSWTSEDATSAVVEFRSFTSSPWTQHSTSLSGSVRYTVGPPSTWPLGFRFWRIRVSNAQGGATSSATIQIIAAPVVTTDSNWSSLLSIPGERSTDSDWSSLLQMTAFDEPATDSDWSSLQRMGAFAEASTDSDWSSFIRLASEPNRPPVWNLPSAFNVTIDNSITLDLLNYCSDPDGDSLSFTASESSSFFSISLSDNILTISGGPDDRRPAGNISLVASDGQATTPASVPVNVLDTSQNAAPVIIPPVPSSSPVIIDGRGTGGGRVFATNQYTATDSDGDTIPTWDADPPNSWRVESEGALSVSTVPNAHQTGFVQLSAIQDYFNRFTIFSSSLTPESAIRGVQFQIRCRDSRRAWSNYVDDEVSLLQPVHGSTHSVDSFTQRPDRRQPNIWAFRKESTAGTNAGGTNYQYATPDEARADKANWAGTIRYAARRLYELIQGTRPLIVIHSIRNVHSSLNAVLDDGDVIFTVKPDAPLSDVGEYSSGHQYVSLCQVLVDGGGGGNPDFWENVSGFLFITGGAPPTVTLLTDGQDVSTYAVAVGTRVTLSWDVTDVASLTLQLIGSSGQPVPYDLDASFSTDYTVAGVFTFRVNATGTNGEVVTDEVVITVTESSLDSEWSSLTRMTPEPSTDSEWSSLEQMTPEPATDSEWSSLEQMTPEPATDSEWSFLEEMTPPTTDGPWSSLEQMTPPAPSTDSNWSSLEQMTPEPATDSEWSFLEEMTPPTTDGPWSAIITTLSLDGPWSAIVVTPTRDGPWSDLVDVMTRDGPWSPIVGLPTVDGPWSDLFGPIICDSLWSPFAVLGTQDGPWSDISAYQAPQTARGPTYLAPSSATVHGVRLPFWI